jgi:hypothetical protein
MFVKRREECPFCFYTNHKLCSSSKDPAIATLKLQAIINKIDDGVKKCRIKINQSKCDHIIIHPIHSQTCLTVQMSNADLPQKYEVKYLGMHLIRRLAWAKDIETKRKHLNQTAKQMNGYLEGNQHYQQKATPIQSSTQTHMDLWNSAVGDASNSNTEILQRFQFNTLRSILNAPWYINTHRTDEDLQINTVLSEIKKWNTKYLRKLENHTNELAVNLLDNGETTHRL